MIIGLLSTLYVFVCFFTILLVLIQRGKNNMGIGTMGGGNQMLFGASGGQDLFQKITWGCLVLFMSGSFVISILKNYHTDSSKYASYYQKALPTAQANALPEATEPSTARE